MNIFIEMLIRYKFMEELIFSEFYVQGSTATPGTQEPPPSETMPKSASFKKKIRYSKNY